MNAPMTTELDQLRRIAELAQAREDAEEAQADYDADLRRAWSHTGELPSDEQAAKLDRLATETALAIAAVRSALTEYHAALRADVEDKR